MSGDDTCEIGGDDESFDGYNLSQLSIPFDHRQTKHYYQHTPLQW